MGGYLTTASGRTEKQERFILTVRKIELENLNLGTLIHFTKLKLTNKAKESAQNEMALVLLKAMSNDPDNWTIVGRRKNVTRIFLRIRKLSYFNNIYF